MRSLYTCNSEEILRNGVCFGKPFVLASKNKIESSGSTGLEVGKHAR